MHSKASHLPVSRYVFPSNYINWILDGKKMIAGINRNVIIIVEINN